MPIQQTDIRGVQFEAVAQMQAGNFSITATSTDSHSFTITDGRDVLELVCDDRVQLIHDMRAFAQVMNDIANKLQMYKVPEPDAPQKFYVLGVSPYDEYNALLHVCNTEQEAHDTANTEVENERASDGFTFESIRVSTFDEDGEETVIDETII